MEVSIQVNQDIHRLVGFLNRNSFNRFTHADVSLVATVLYRNSNDYDLTVNVPLWLKGFPEYERIKQLLISSEFLYLNTFSGKLSFNEEFNSDDVLIKLDKDSSQQMIEPLQELPELDRYCVIAE